MAQGRQIFLMTLLLAAAVWKPATGHQPPRFLPDDPIQAMPAPLPILTPVHRHVDSVFDFLAHSTKTSEPRIKVPAGAVNTMGEVPDSEWFTNRHGRKRMSRRELQQGSDSGGPPLAPFKVISGKDDGVMPGFRMLDSKGRQYFVKGDPAGFPELQTSAEAIVSRFLYAIGYDTPKNDIVDLKPSDLRVSNQARITVGNGQPRPMTWSDIEAFIKQISKHPDGSFRVIASLAVKGESIGPFRYEGTRSDDPNDITPHENRRDLRGLYVFCAWLNHTDAKAGNTLDTVVEENGKRFVRHHLIDFGSALGSDGDGPKDPRLGSDYMLSTPGETLKQIFTLGVAHKEWERMEFPKLKGIGNLESHLFRPDQWKPDYPNEAFVSRLADDDFWAAKQIMAFTNDDIRAIVDTARFTEAESTEYMVATLAERRDKIGIAFFSKLLPLDQFRVENSKLVFEDLAARYGFQPSLHYQVRWFRFNNNERKQDRITGDGSPQLPLEAVQAAPGSYYSAFISAPGEGVKTVTVFIRKEQLGFKVVGIDRAW